MNLQELKYSEYFTNLTLGLLESFYPFTKEEVIKYQDIFDWDDERIIKNPNVSWDTEVVDGVKDKINFKTLYRAKNLTIDYDFLHKFEQYFDFSSLAYYKHLAYSKEIIEHFDSKLDWAGSLIRRDGFTSLDNFRKYKDVLDWDKLSGSLKFPLDASFFDEFSDYLNWDKLSYNSSLHLDIELLEKYKEKFNFKHLSWNPAAAEIILRYPNSSKWNWNLVLRNEGVEINDENIEILSKYYAKGMQSISFLKDKPLEFIIKIAKNNVVSHLIEFRTNGIDYLFNEKFKENYIWNFIAEACSTLPENFVLDNFSKFKKFGSEFLNKNGKYFSSELIQKNIEKFDLSKWNFYKLNITMEIVNDNFEEINFLWLSSNESIEWNPDFIYNNRDRLNFYRLSENQKVYKDLLGNWSREDVFSFLNKQN